MSQWILDTEVMEVLLLKPQYMVKGNVELIQIYS